MTLSTYHVYLDWQDFTVRAVRLHDMGRQYASLTETLWQIQAENKDDAFRASVEKGLVADLIQKTEARLKIEKDYITAHGNNPYDGSVGAVRAGMEQIERKLAQYTIIQSTYSPS